MKNKFSKLLLSFACGLGLAAVSNVATAYWYDGYGGPRYHSYYGGGYGHYKHYRHYKHYKHNYRCKWIPGHWAYGYWYPARQVCWRR